MIKKEFKSYPKGLYVIAFFVIALAGISRTAAGQEMKANLFKQLKYRHIGPVGNRVIAVVGVPGEANICYAGAASGGIFKSEDGGINWKPIFDKQPVSSVGSLAIAPSDSNVIWAGTGETFIRSNISHGDGIYKSTDTGKTWKKMGLEKTGRIGRIVIDPRNPDIVFAAAMGHCYGPQKDRGVFRTTDGGKTWEKVLFVDENTGCSDIAMDPNNPRILFAGMWPMLIRTWGKWSGGPDGGLFKSVDGGTTWKRLKGKGLPEGEIGKVAVAVAPSDSDRVYALIEHKDEGLWRSDDGGETWRKVNHNRAILNRPLYYTRCVVAPDDPDEVYFPATRFHMTLDGGLDIKRFNPSGGDHHDMWIDPLNPDRMMVGNDQGVSISPNRGKSWHGIQLPIAQMYHVYVDDRIPYYVYGNRQDGSSYGGPSNSRMGRGGIPRGLWHPVGGFESGFAVPDPVDNNIIWSGNYDGMLDVFDMRTKQSRGVTVWPEGIQGWAPKDVKYRFQWTFPIAISPHDHNRVYVGSQYVHRTSDGGQSWNIISPDLSTNDKSKQERTGGITYDDASPLYCCTLFAIAESPLQEGLIWAGTNDGLLHVTRDGGENWTNVTKNIPDLPEWGTISNIEPSRFDAGTCYITIDFHQVNDFDPYVFKTSDYGKKWKRISSDIPKGVLSFAHCVKEDPVRKGLLYLGTENALYVSFNDGKNWTPLQSNLPHAPVHWLTIQERFSDLVVGTYGRGFWILDDISPLQQMTQEVLDSEVHLFDSRPAYRFRNIAGPSGTPNDPCAGQNPPYGASISYYLKSEPKEEVVFTILDETGKTIRTLKTEKPEDMEPDSFSRGQTKPFKVPKQVGLNRIGWDLRYDRTKMIKLRTKPIGQDHVELGDKGWRAFPRGSRGSGPLVPPGVYTVRLTVGDKAFSQKLTVIKDPHSTGMEADILEQTKILLEIHRNINAVADMINEIEWIRKQLYDLKELLTEKQGTETIIKAGDELDQKFIEIESFLFSMELSGSGDGLRWPDKFYVRLRFLANDISKSDFPPTSQQIEVHEMFKEQLADHQERLKQLIEKDVKTYNDLLKEKKIPNIFTDLK
ncbi:MAG: sialidase [Candidatus Aminicenantes bacterium]|nr:MAG: sialidase [Candidatus Aminicenantes bacterium]